MIFIENFVIKDFFGARRKLCLILYQYNCICISAVKEQIRANPIFEAREKIPALPRKKGGTRGTVGV